MLGQLRKDIDNAQQRIFNHRAFVSGEIDSFLQNFEVKRNDREVEKLFKVTEAIGELKYDLTERCLILAKSNIDPFAKELNQLFAGVNDFLQQAQQEKPVSETLLKARQDREKRRLLYLEELEHKYQRLDSSFEQKEEEIAEFYKDLEQKLNIHK